MKWMMILLVGLLACSAVSNFYSLIELNDIIAQQNAELQRLESEYTAVKEVFDQAEKIKQHIEKHSSASEEMQRDISYAIIFEAKRNNIDPELITALATVESNFNPSAIGGVGERGIVQIRKATFQEHGQGDFTEWRDTLRLAFDIFGISKSDLAMKGWHWPPTMQDRAGGRVRLSGFLGGMRLE